MIQTGMIGKEIAEGSLRWTSSSLPIAAPHHFLNLPAWISHDALQSLQNAAEILGESDGVLPVEPIKIPKTPSKRFYNQYYTYFYRSYFYKNLYKSLILVNILKHHFREFDSFIDIGSGSAPLSVAICMNNNVNKIQLVDRSRNHVNIGRKILKKLSPKTKINILNASIENVIFPRNVPVLASYVFCEMIDNKIDYHDLIIRSDFILILDKKETILQLCAELSEKKRITSGHVEFEIGSDISELIEGGAGKFSYALVKDDNYPY